MIVVANVESKTPMSGSVTRAGICEIELPVGLFPVQLRIYDKDGARRLATLLQKFIEGRL